METRNDCYSAQTHNKATAEGTREFSSCLMTYHKSPVSWASQSFILKSHPPDVRRCEMETWAINQIWRREQVFHIIHHDVCVKKSGCKYFSFSESNLDVFVFALLCVNLQTWVSTENSISKPFSYSSRPLCYRSTRVLASAHPTPRWWSSAACCSSQSTQLWTETSLTSPIACWKTSTRYKLWHWGNIVVSKWKVKSTHSRIMRQKSAAGLVLTPNFSQWMWIVYIILYMITWSQVWYKTNSLNPNSSHANW